MAALRVVESIDSQKDRLRGRIQGLCVEVVEQERE
jgi:hypothetical protein